MTKPTIHMNGTSAEELRDIYVEAYRAVNEAIEKVSAASPNGRDYYPQSATAINDAISEHRERLTKLQAVSEDMLALATHADGFTK